MGFHHILSELKREAILDWAAELSLGGWSRHGTPGCILAEGAVPRPALHVAEAGVHSEEGVKVGAVQAVKRV